MSGRRISLKVRKVQRAELGAAIRRQPYIRQNTITFIFLGLINDIDFLRRNGEWSRRWVVDDIEATIDLGGERIFAGAGGLANAGLASWRSTSQSKVVGA